MNKTLLFQNKNLENLYSAKRAIGRLRFGKSQRELLFNYIAFLVTVLIYYILNIFLKSSYHFGLSARLTEIQSVIVLINPITTIQEIKIISHQTIPRTIKLNKLTVKYFLVPKQIICRKLILSIQYITKPISRPNSTRTLQWNNFGNQSWEIKFYQGISILPLC